MRQSTTLYWMAILVAQASTAPPPLISFKDGKVGVNFGGYHAAAGLGGIFGQGEAGGLFAEAGTPYGQNARAGLGGAVDRNGQSSGGLYAGATAGGNVKAQAGLAGGVTGEHSAGAGYASAQAGDRFASAGMGGEASDAGASGFKFSGTKSFGVSGGKVKEVVLEPVDITAEHKDVTDIKIESDNEIQPIPEQTPVTVVKEVYAPPPTKVVEKTYVRSHYKPHRHHFRKYVSGYVGGEAGLPPPAGPAIESQTAIQKRIDDIAAVSAAGAESHVEAPAGQIGYTKRVTFQRNPTFYQDIFNIPISVLDSVSRLVGNIAGGTSVSVQKSASVHTDADGESSKHHIAPLSSSSSSESHLSIQTPSASNILADIFAIPINTLGAVSKFLENRKTVQVTQDHHEASSAPIRVRRGRGPHARRANKVVVVETQEQPHSDTPSDQ